MAFRLSMGVSNNPFQGLVTAVSQLFNGRKSKAAKVAQQALQAQAKAERGSPVRTFVKDEELVARANERSPSGEKLLPNGFSDISDVEADNIINSMHAEMFGNRDDE